MVLKINAFPFVSSLHPPPYYSSHGLKVLKSKVWNLLPPGNMGCQDLCSWSQEGDWEENSGCHDHCDFHSYFDMEKPTVHRYCRASSLYCPPSLSLS